MDRLSLITQPIITELEEFKHLFESSLSGSNPLLEDALGHIRQKNGKRMRPVLVILLSRLLGGCRPETLYSAVSLELLHTASLVHDDVVDESTERRGQLSVNAIFNNKVAVLVGDYLLATSLLHAAKTMNHGIIQVISCLGQELAEGELLQLSNVNNPVFSEEIYFEVIRKKTAALFSACTTSAALSTGAKEGDVQFARLLGEYIGTCFQIRDDIFDYYEDHSIGKPTGNDMLEGKLTIPVIYALNTTQDAPARELALKVKAGTATTEEIAELIAFAKANGGIEYATELMYSYKNKAFELLCSFPPSDIRASLEVYLDYLVEREK